MKIRKVFTICLFFIAIMTFFAIISIASDDNTQRNVAANQDGASAEVASARNIPCNWEGWRGCLPEVKCKRSVCNSYQQVLKFKCTAGVLAEVGLEMACVACRPPEVP